MKVARRRSTISAESTRANGRAYRSRSGRAGAGAHHGGHYSHLLSRSCGCRSFHNPANKDVPFRVDRPGNRISQKESVDGRPAIAFNEGGVMAYMQCFNNPVIGPGFPNARPGTGKVNIACAVHRDPGRPRDACIDGRAPIAAVLRYARSGNRGDDPGQDLHSPYAIVIAIVYVEVPGSVQRDPDGFSDRCTGRLSLIAAVAQNSLLTRLWRAHRPASGFRCADEAAPVIDDSIAFRVHPRRSSDSSETARFATPSCRQWS